MMETSAAIAKIQQRLAGNAGARLTVEPDSIRVVPLREGGFEVGLAERDGRFTVWFLGWHEQFGAEEAVDCLTFGLTRRCRLRVHSAGRLDYRWAVEYQHDGRWVEDSATGLLFWPFWKKRTVRTLQNDVLQWEEEP